MFVLNDLKFRMNYFINKLRFNKVFTLLRCNLIKNPHYGKTPFSSLAKQTDSKCKNENVLVVKNNILSFDVNVNNRGTEYLQITEYRMDGYKEAQLQLSKDEAYILDDSLKDLLAIPLENRTNTLSLGEENCLLINISTEVSHIGPMCIISYVDGLYKKMQPLRFPWCDSINFSQCLNNCFNKSEN